MNPKDIENPIAEEDFRQQIRENMPLEKAELKLKDIENYSNQLLLENEKLLKDYPKLNNDDVVSACTKINVALILKAILK